MPASPLTAALMAGGGNEGGLGMMAMDPAVMAAQPDLQLAQAMLQGGLSTAPASPWQALGRVAQAAAGGYIQRSTISDLARAYSGSAENMAQVFDQTAGPNNIVSRMLRSPDPVVRMQGMQLAQKAGLQVNEENPTLAGQKAGAVAGAEAPFKKGPDITVNGPNGPTQMPTTMETIHNMQPGASPAPSAAMPPPAPGQPKGSVLPYPPGTSPPQIIPGGGGPTPSAAVQPPAPQPSQPAAPRLASVGEVEGAKTAAQKIAENKAEFGDLLNAEPTRTAGPGTTEPIQTDRGTTLPAVKEQSMPTSAAELRTAVPAWQKTQDEWQAGIQPAYRAQIQLTAMANAYKQIQSGAWATHKAQLAAALKAADLPDSIVQAVAGGDPSQVQIALHSNYVETLNQLKQSTPRFTQMEFRALSENKEHPNLQPEANLEMLSQDIGTLRQAIDLPNDFTAARQFGWKNPQAFEQAWLKQNPLSGYVKRAKDEIGPLKGMPQTGQTGTWKDPVTGKTYQIINGVPHE